MTQLQYAMALQAVPDIRDITAKKLIHYFGSPEAVFKASKRSLYTISGMGSVTVNNLQSSKAMALAEKELIFNQKHNINAFYFEETGYPYRLKHCIDGPIVLFLIGAII